MKSAKPVRSTPSKRKYAKKVVPKIQKQYKKSMSGQRAAKKMDTLTQDMREKGISKRTTAYGLKPKRRR